MAIDVAKILGVNPADVQQGKNVLNELRDDLDCMRGDIQALTRLMSYHYGKARQDAEGYDPAALPGIYRIQPAVGKTLSIDFRALLGKPATYGWLKNIGTEDLELVHVKANQGSDGTTKTNVYVFEAGERLPIDGITDLINVTTPAAANNAGDVQVYAR